MIESTRIDEGDIPEFGVKGAHVARITNCLMRVSRARTPKQARGRLRELRDDVRANDCVDEAFLAVQESRELGILSTPEATFLLDMIEQVACSPYTTAGVLTPADRRSAKAAFFATRGESALAEVVRSRPQEHRLACCRGKALQIRTRRLPEVWGDDEPRASAVAAIGERVAAVAASDRPDAWKTAVAALLLEMQLHDPVSAVAAIQTARSVGLITFAQSAALMWKALDGQIHGVITADRQLAILALRSIDEDDTPALHRTELITATVFRRIGEHRAASILASSPGEFDRVVYTAWRMPRADGLEWGRDPDVAPAPREEIVDTRIVGRLNGRAVRAAKTELLRVLDARSRRQAERYFERLAAAADTSLDTAEAAFTATQELHDLQVIDAQEFHFLIHRFATSLAQAERVNPSEGGDERTSIAACLRMRGEPSIANMVTGGSRTHSALSAAGRSTLLRTRPTPHRHLNAPVDPGAVAVLCEKLAVFAAHTDDESALAAWKAVLTQANRMSAASVVFAVNHLRASSAMPDYFYGLAMVTLVELSVRRFIHTDRNAARTQTMMNLMDRVEELRGQAVPADPLVAAAHRSARLRFDQQLDRRQEQLVAATCRRLGQHRLADVTAALLGEEWDEPVEQVGSGDNVDVAAERAEAKIRRLTSEKAAG
jgi:hypothetical protein